MKYTLLIVFTFLISVLFAQNPPVNCDDAVEGCSTPSFPITGQPGPTNIVDFGSGTGSNPSSNPNPSPGNSGCLLSGETTSTFITINVVSNGTLEWAMQGTNGNGFFDWIMWPYVYPAPGASSPTCAMLQAGTQPPVACNWNASSAGFTGMAAPGNLPPGAPQGNFENALNVTAGQTFLLCLSNYSGTTQNVNLGFTGSASVVCGVSAPDQTICLGASANVTITTPGLASPTFNWLVTNGVSNTTGGTNVSVTPLVTTAYQVEVTQLGGGGAANFVDTATFTITVENPPVPNAGPDQNICLGDPIQLAGIQSNPSNGLVWQYSAAGIVPAPVVNFAPNFSDPNAVVNTNQPGSYLFFLQESNPVCGNVFDTVQVIVSDLNISASFVAPSCQGLADGEIHIDAPGANEYSFDNGTTWQADSFAVTFTAGIYDVCARTPLGCMKCTQITVVDPAPVTISVSNDTTICQNGTGYLSATATGGTSYNFHWGMTGDLNSAQIVNPINTGYFTVYSENQNGCTSPLDSILVTVLAPISGSISPFDTVCPTFSTDITAVAGGGIGQPYTFTWSTGDTYTGVANHQINVTPSITTTYTVTINDGCESSPLILSTDIRVAPLPVPTYLVTNPIQCEPAEFEIINTTGPTMSQFVYWEVDGFPYLNQDTILSQELMAGNYDIFMIATSYEGCVDSILYPNALHVDPIPEALFHFTPDPVMMFNTDVTFLNYSYNGDSYQWFFPGGTPAASTQEDVQVRYPDGVIDSYEVTLITTSALGCVDTLVKTIVVNPEVILYAPNTFTPDGDEFNQDWKIYIEGIDIYNFELFIFNRWGEVVWESHDPSVGWDGTYKGKIIPQGTYTWIIRTNDQLNDNKHVFNGFVNIIR